jgi:hypothetical protein
MLAQSGESWFALAGHHFSERRIPEAIFAYDRAEKSGHDPDQCAGGRWMCWMLLGRFDRAWEESDAIARRGRPDPHRFWDGAPFTGKRVILRCLHGLGDAIQFIRYAPLVRSQAAQLVVETHPEMVDLLRGVAAVDDVISWRDPPPKWDQQIEIMELPRALGAAVDTIPSRVPYIAIDPNRSRAIGNSGARKVGLLWSSSTWDPARSIPAGELAPILQVPECSFYNLQHGSESARIEMHPTAAQSGDIAATAADICQLDLVVTVDTMVAHLAGALGKPVWTLLPYRADWRWMIDRADSPWYPTMRLFRQSSPGDWSTVIAEVAAELENR